MGFCRSNPKAAQAFWAIDFRIPCAIDVMNHDGGANFNQAIDHASELPRPITELFVD